MSTELQQLQSIYQSWILSGFPGSKVLASNGHHFFAESAQGELCLYEVRIPGVVSGPPRRIFELKRVKDAIVRATLRKKDILEALITAVTVLPGQKTEGAEGPQFRFDPRTRRLQWAHIYPEEDLPVLDIVHKKAAVPKDAKDTLVVTHKMKGFGLTQVHVYVMRVADVSQKLRASILEHANYPSLIPHSHTILDGDRVIYDRKIEHWAEHSATKDAYTGSVQIHVCASCRSSFFGFVGESRCRECQEVVGVGVVKVKNALIKKARAAAESTDWRAGGEAMRELMDQWKAAGHAGDQEDGLWTQLQAARQTFFDARTAFFEGKQVLQGSALDVKKQLIEKAKKLSNSSEWKETSAALRDLMEQWRAAGSAGKEHEEALWQEFHGARQKFFDRQSNFFGR
jgi:hypothetical protein